MRSGWANVSRWSGLAGRAGEAVLSLFVAVWLAAALICWAPGTGIDEAEFDAGRTTAGVEELRRQRAQDASITQTLWNLGQGLVTGDLGHSHAFNRPARELLAERLPVTAALVASGLAVAWLAGLALALAGLGGARIRIIPVALVSLLVCIPAAVVALGCAVAGWPAAVALGAAVMPKVFSYSDEIFQRGLLAPHRMMALARGVRPAKVFWSHLLAPAWPEFRALASVTLPLAIGAAIPVEVFTDTPGIGQLAWKAATGRDVTLLLYLTVLLTAITLLTGGLHTDRERRHG